MYTLIYFKTFFRNLADNISVNNEEMSISKRNDF